jgi:ubiquinone/menaquinone biosynthesis C-methylase UbiE
MRRTTTAELLDDDRGTAAEIAESLDDLWRINRWLGGVSTNLRMLERFFARTGPHPVRILDVGTGDARLAALLESELRRRNYQAEFVALDRRLGHLKNGHPRASGVKSVVADVFSLPFPEKSFEVVMCNLFLHHFSGELAIHLLRRLARMASEAVLINDLARGFLPYLFIRAAYPFARSRITRHDGPASVRQAYTREELRALAADAGFRNFEVSRLPLYRLGLTLWEKSPGAGN